MDIDTRVLVVKLKDMEPAKMMAEVKEESSLDWQGRVISQLCTNMTA